MTTDVFADLKWRGLIHQTTAEDLKARLGAQSLTLYHGIDATADSLHVGNLLGVVALQRLQRAGHRPIVLLGGATSLIGDPSGRETERQMLPREEVDANVAAIRSQLERFLDFGAGLAQAALVNNAEWLGPIPLLDFLRDVGKHFPVNVMVAKESVRSRMQAGISFTEFSYMLLQAYDFLHLYDTRECRLQVGGSDQWGNITAGVDLVRRVRSAEVWGLTWPLITKADGTKFGKSEAGNVWLDPEKTSPYEFFQFWIRTDDRDVGRYLRMFTMLDPAEIETLDIATRKRPRERAAQRALAVEVTAAVHGREAAAGAAHTAELLFAEGSHPTANVQDAPSTTLARSELEEGLPLIDLLIRTGLTKSRTSARTAIQQGGVYVNDIRETDLDRVLTPADGPEEGILLRRGKRSYHVVRFR